MAVAAPMMRVPREQSRPHRCIAADRGRESPRDIVQLTPATATTEDQSGSSGLPWWGWGADRARRGLGRARDVPARASRRASPKRPDGRTATAGPGRGRTRVTVRTASSSDPLRRAGRWHRDGRPANRGDTPDGARRSAAVTWWRPMRTPTGERLGFQPVGNRSLERIGAPSSEKEAADI